jgi:hypothetical protein
MNAQPTPDYSAQINEALTGDDRDAKDAALKGIFCGKMPNDDVRYALHWAALEGTRLPDDLPGIMKSLGYESFTYDANQHANFHNIVQRAMSRNGDYLTPMYSKQRIAGKSNFVHGMYTAYASKHSTLAGMAEQYLSQQAIQRLFR